MLDCNCVSGRAWHDIVWSEEERSLPGSQHVGRCRVLTTRWRQQLQVINQVTGDATVTRVFRATSLQDHTYNLGSLGQAWATYTLIKEGRCRASDFR